MKKLLFALLVLISAVSKAQDFQGGALLGVAGSQIDLDRSIRVNYNKPGLALGAFVRYPLTKELFWQMEFKYIGKGSSTNNMDSTSRNNLAATGDPTIQSRVSLNYFEMPFLILYKYNQKFSFEGGLGFGYLISSSGTDSQGESASNAGFFNSIDYTYILGVYYNLTPTISFNIRYCYSLVPISDFGTHLFLSRSGQFNNTVVASLYFRLDGNNQ